MRLYAGQFPSDVAGLVFVDPLPVGFIDRFLTLVSSNEPGFSSLMGADNIERMDQLNSLRQADTAAAPPAVPIVVIVHGLFLGFPLNFPVDQLETAWRSDQEAYAAANHALLRVAKTSGNSIVRDQPDLVIEAVNTVLEAVRNPTSVQTTLVINRSDGNGRRVSGSCFQVFSDAGNGARGEFRGGACDPDSDGVSDGVIEFDPMPPGNYVLQEAKAPDGVPALADAPVTLVGLATTVTLSPPAVATPAVTPTT
jgi:hypothetical protein